jgi:hypothetical protein
VKEAMLDEGITEEALTHANGYAGKNTKFDQTWTVLCLELLGHSKLALRDGNKREQKKLRRRRRSKTRRRKSQFLCDKPATAATKNSSRHRNTEAPSARPPRMHQQLITTLMTRVTTITRITALKRRRRWSLRSSEASTQRPRTKM